MLKWFDVMLFIQGPHGKVTAADYGETQTD